MSAFIVSPTHLAVIVSASVQPHNSNVLFTEFLKEAQAIAKAGKLHPVDADIAKELMNYDYVTTFATENFCFLAKILASAMVTGVNDRYPNSEQEDLDQYVDDVKNHYKSVKERSKSLSFLQYTKLLHCYAYQACELKNHNESLAFVFVKLAHQYGHMLNQEEYNKLDWAI